MTARPAHLRSRLAVTRVGPISVAIEAERVAGFLEPGARTADFDLAAVLGVAPPAEDGERLLELSHTGGTLVVAVHAPVRMGDGDDRLPWARPALIDGALRRACLRGVRQHEAELVFLLDVDAMAARFEAAGKENAACESD